MNEPPVVKVFITKDGVQYSFGVLFVILFIDTEL